MTGMTEVRRKSPESRENQLGNERLRCLLYFDQKGEVVTVGAEDREAMAEHSEETQRQGPGATP